MSLKQTFKLEVRMNNDNFQPEYQQELARILDNVKHKVLDGIAEGAVLDVNGNVVGAFKVATSRVRVACAGSSNV